MIRSISAWCARSAGGARRADDVQELIDPLSVINSAPCPCWKGSVAVRLPTLLMAARDDVLVPSSVSEGLAAAIEGATLHITPWGAHAVNVTQAESFNFLLLDFLDRHAGPRP
jgi:alpha-beta hydrolase superfamily lysophospholipase